MKNYRKRIADDILMRKLEGKGAVLKKRLRRSPPRRSYSYYIPFAAYLPPPRACVCCVADCSCNNRRCHGYGS